MNEKVNRFKNNCKAVVRSVTKQKMILIWSLFACAMGICLVWIDYSQKNLNFLKLTEHGFQALIFGTLFCFSTSYLTQRLTSCKKYLIQTAFAAGSSLISFCILHFVPMKDYAFMYNYGLLFGVLCFTICVFIPRENQRAYYANMFKNFLFCGLLVFVGFLGSILLVFAFSNLIYEFSEIDNVILTFAVIFFWFVYVNLYAFYFFEKREENSGKAFKIVFMYVAFPVYVLLLFVLYLYLLKALVLWALPQGQINWFVSFASAIYMVFYFILREYEDFRVIKLFYKFGALLLIPLICVQFPAYFIRVNAYGFTGWRYTSLIFNIFTVLFVLFTFVKKGRFVKYAIPVLGGLAVFVTLSPWNLIDVAYKSQFKRLTRVMEKYGMYDGKIKTDYNAVEVNKKITDEDREVIFASYQYIAFTSEHKKPEWISTNGYSIEKSLGIEREKYKENIVKKNLSYEGNCFDISGYSSMKRLQSKNMDSSHSVSAYIIDGTFSVNLTDYLLNCENLSMPLEIESSDGSKKIILYDFEYTYDKDEKKFSRLYYIGYLLSKE